MANLHFLADWTSTLTGDIHTEQVLFRRIRKAL